MTRRPCYSYACCYYQHQYCPGTFLANPNKWYLPQIPCDCTCHTKAQEEHNRASNTNTERAQ